MSHNHHGFSVSVERVADDKVLLTMHARGKLQHEDYATMVPMLETAIAGMKSPKIDVMMDVREMDGWEMHAAWDDFKLGLKHGHQFNKVAMVGSKSWQETAAKIGSWFIGGEARFFEDKTAALAWLVEEG
ncbi:STAS/SEC14 domain-containing protein [Microbulbifer agarilyticus]|uniref:STAS/SEC14 domain-containing protein n=1 Tax=Microbulbifer agarilyticus TaxID=260552 RepID=A0A1Q2M1K8_9GAMM|nr:STAS/SEC14 domain-containing protein [Microbulbifer agarilyticus]AQQ66585.1 STAS/SEC14 domain-containing protein [Microbulbifer agarilyticus]